MTNDEATWDYILTSTTDPDDSYEDIGDSYFDIIRTEFCKIFEKMSCDNSIVKSNYGTGTLEDPESYSCIIIIELGNRLAPVGRLAGMFQYWSMMFGHRIIFMSGYALSEYGDADMQDALMLYVDEFYDIYSEEEFFDDVFDDFTIDYVNETFNSYQNAEIYLDSNLVPGWDDTMTLGDAYGSVPNIRRIIDRIADYYNESADYGDVLTRHNIRIFLHSDANEFISIDIDDAGERESVCFQQGDEIIFNVPRFAVTAAPITDDFYSCFLDIQDFADQNGTLFPVYLFGEIPYDPNGLHVVGGFSTSASVLSDILDAIGTL